MVDQSHNLKSKIEEMIQTITTAQEIFAKAALVDHAQLTLHQRNCDLIDAEECLKSAFSTDVRPSVEQWRLARGLAAHPLCAFRDSGYLAQVARERAGHAQPAASYA